MRQALESREAFEGFLSQIEESFNKSVRQLRINLDRKVTMLENNVLDNYDRTFYVEEQPNRARDKLRRELSEFTRDALTQLDSSIRADPKAALQSSTRLPPQDVQPYLDEIDDVQFTLKATASQKK